MAISIIGPSSPSAFALRGLCATESDLIVAVRDDPEIQP
jgi:hypothetical protein